MESIGRKTLPHDGHPLSSDSSEAEVYMITICTKPRGLNQLAHQEIWNAVEETLRKRMQEEVIQCRLALAMPDHLHALMSFPGRTNMQAAIKSLKSWLAKSQSIQWQRDFFDHRLRGLESAAEKANYIRMNPVRAGLVESPEQWPFWMEPGRDPDKSGSVTIAR